MSVHTKMGWVGVASLLISGCLDAPALQQLSSQLAPSEIQLVASARSATQVDLSWSATQKSKDTVGYKVILNDQVIANVSTTKYLSNGLSPVTPYRFTVAAYNKEGATTALSNLAPVQTLAQVSGAAANPLWAKNFSSGGLNALGGVITDPRSGTGSIPTGSVIVAGSFGVSMNFGGTTTTSSGATDAFLASYSPTGNLNWVKTYGGPSEDVLTHLVGDAQGNFYITGYFRGPTSSFGTAATCQLNLGSANYGEFVAKMDNAGTCLWAQLVTSGNSPQSIATLAVNATNGNVVVGGTFTGGITFGGTTINSGAHSDGFVFLLDSTGTAQWGESIMVTKVNTQDAGISTVAFDPAGSVIVSGSSGSPFQFGTGSILNGGIFHAKLSAVDGSSIWANAYAVSGGGQGSGVGLGPVAVNSSGDIYALFKVTGGTSAATLPFGAVTLGTAAGTQTYYLTKLSGANGQIPTSNWPQPLGFTSPANVVQSIGNIALSSSGEVVLAGNFASQFSVGCQTMTANPGARDAFIAKFSSALSCLWSGNVFPATTNGGGFAVEASYGLSIDATTQEISWIGMYQGPGSVFNFMGSNLSVPMVDAWVARLSP